MMNFEDLNLILPLIKAVKMEGYEKPTPIQEKAIPYVLAGKDILGCAQTGTGKTAAFVLPILQRICERKGQKDKRYVRALTLTPTRELAEQIGESFTVYGRNIRLKHAVIYGGVSQSPQVYALNRGVDILVATPGRLLDLTLQGFIDYRELEVFVLDEADRMLDMGFIDDVRKIVKLLPSDRQTLFFSATMPDKICQLAEDILNNPIQVSVAPPCSVVDIIEQSVYFVDKYEKASLLAHLFKNPDFKRVLIFTRTKHDADKVAHYLSRCYISTRAIHGDKSQKVRQNTLECFKQGNIRALVATDIASRGIDVDNITHVINFDIPSEPESYVHRIGRTGRAGASGMAISFCDYKERVFLSSIEHLIKKQICHASDYSHKYSYRPNSPIVLTQWKRNDRQNNSANKIFRKRRSSYKN